MFVLGKQWVIHIDGMDIGKTCFPHVIKGHKGLNVNKKSMLRIHTIGVIGYGTPLPVVTLVNNVDEFSNDTNLNLTALHLTLEAYAKELVELQAVISNDYELYKTMSERDVEKHKQKRKAEGIDEYYLKWPDTLFIYGDNATINKSNAFMWYCANLVRQHTYIFHIIYKFTCNTQIRTHT